MIKANVIGRYVASSPKVSVLLTSYNHAAYLEQSIESVLSQTFTNYELIIWDDCSSDDSWSIIRGYADPRIRAFRGNSNTCGEYINEMVSKANAEFIAILHSDDYWEPSKLSRQIDILNARPDIGACFTHAKVLREGELRIAGNTGCEDLQETFRQPNRSRHQWLRKFFFTGNQLCHPSVVMRQQCLQSAGGYSCALYQLPDFHLWIKLCMLHEIYVLPEQLITFRRFDDLRNQSASRPDSQVRYLHEFYHVLSEYKKLSLEELCKIFPEAAYYCGNDLGSSVPLYLLAMVALTSEESGYVQRSFGADLLTECLMDSRKYSQIAQVHGFKRRQLLKPELLVDHYHVLQLQSLEQHSRSQLRILSDCKSRQHDLIRKIEEYESRQQDLIRTIEDQKARQKSGVKRYCHDFLCLIRSIKRFYIYAIEYGRRLVELLKRC